MPSSSQSIGSAYINIKPKMDSSFSSDVKSGVSAPAEEGGRSFGDIFSVAAGTLIAKGVEKLASVAADTFKRGFENYANYEQLIGGVETLFKDSAGIVEQNASQAFKTAGMSANEYMENVTNFSASLLAGLGGDTQKAAAYADRAVRDMSDNANKFGTDIGRITDAYQGFSKQNYTMLDNLKLGYGGTKEEMQRLIADASKMTDVQQKLGVTVDESSMSFDNVVNAISVMQEHMGIAGTTASEAEHTISGSLSMLSASWDNFLTGIFDDDADMGALGEQLLHSLGTVIQNVVPRLLTAIGRIITGLPQAIAGLLRGIPDMLAPAISEIFGEGVGNLIGSSLGESFGRIGDSIMGVFGRLGESLGGMFERLREPFSRFGEAFGKLFDSLSKLFATLMDVLGPVIDALVNVAGVVLEVVLNALTTAFTFLADVVVPGIQAFVEYMRPAIELISSIISAAMEVIQAIIDAVWPHIQEVVIGAMDAIKPVIENATNTIKTITETAWPYIQAVIDVAVNAIKGFIDNVWPAIQATIQNVMAVIQGVINTVWPAIQAIMQTVMGAIQAVVQTVWPAIQGIVEGAVNGIKAAIDGINACIGVVQGIFDGIRHAIEDPINTARDLVHDAIEAIKGFFNFDIQWPHIPLPHFNVSGSPNPLDWVSQGAPTFSIDWYAKGGFVDGATLIGAGEAGPEMILPRQGALINDFAGAIAARVGEGERTVELLEALLEKQGDVYMDGRRVGHVMAPFVDAEFATNARRAAYA